MPDQPDQLPAADYGGALFEVEVLPPALAEASPPNALMLLGDAARDVRESLGTALIASARTGGRRTEETFRLVASEQASKGLADGSLRWANVSKGDASVLIKDTGTGRIVEHGRLDRVRPSPAKVLGPAVWEAMALATQQHYLVEINERLQSIEAGVSELLAQMDGDKRGTLAQVRKVAASSRQRVAEGGSLSDARVHELQDGAQRADEVWHQLHDRMARQLDEYRRGERSHAEVEASWAMLLYATQVVAETSAALTAVPYDSVGQLEDATSEERERVLHAVDSVRELADALHDAHLHWSARHAEWRLQRTRNPARNVVRAARKTGVRKPAQQPLAPTTAWRATQLALPPQPPAALLVSVNGDATVAVVAEPARHEVA
jgi:hypothetical protein